MGTPKINGLGEKDFLDAAQTNPRFLRKLQSHMRSLEITGVIVLQQLWGLVQDMQEQLLGEESTHVQERLAEALAQLSEENLGEELAWIALAESALGDDHRVDRWLDGQDYGVDPIHLKDDAPWENGVPRLTPCLVYNSLVEFEATLEKGRFLLNCLRYGKIRSVLEETVKKKLIH